MGDAGVDCVEERKDLLNDLDALDVVWLLSDVFLSQSGLHVVLIQSGLHVLLLQCGLHVLLS